MAGICTRAEIEAATSEDKIDHVWITLDAGLSTQILVSINTLSTKNRMLGFDPRVRMGVLSDIWTVLPSKGAGKWPKLDYGEFEDRNNIFYESFERPELESILLEWASDSIFIEAWGAPFFRKAPGIHQIHSRAKSCAVSQELHGRDGAVKFYFAKDNQTKMVFFKFCGQR